MLEEKHGPAGASVEMSERSLDLSATTAVGYPRLLTSVMQLPSKSSTQDAPIERILSFLPFWDIAKLPRICKIMHYIATEPEFKVWNEVWRTKFHNHFSAGFISDILRELRMSQRGRLSYYDAFRDAYTRMYAGVNALTVKQHNIIKECDTSQLGGLDQKRLSQSLIRFEGSPRPLHETAAKRGSQEVCDFLFKAACLAYKAGELAEKLGPYNVTIMYWAIVLNQRDAVEMLASKVPALVSTPAKYNEMPIFTALSYYNSRALRSLIKAGADVNIVCPQTGATPLICASFSYEYQMVELLLDAKANPNTPNQKRLDSPLFLAASFGAAKSVKRLLASGANPEQRNAKGETAVFGAAHFIMQDVSILQHFVDAKADLSARRNDGQTVLDLMGKDRRRFRDAYVFLVEHGARSGQEAAPVRPQARGLFDGLFVRSPKPLSDAMQSASVSLLSSEERSLTSGGPSIQVMN